MKTFITIMADIVGPEDTLKQSGEGQKHLQNLVTLLNEEDTTKMKTDETTTHINITPSTDDNRVWGGEGIRK